MAELIQANTKRQRNMKNYLIRFFARFPQRWVMTVMGMLGVTMAFTMRGCLSITMTQMVVPPTSSRPTDVLRGEVCPVREQWPAADHYHDHDDDDETATTAPGGDSGDRFSWDEGTQGMILSAFYYGYIVTHIPGGWLAQNFGGKYTVAYAILSTSTLTLLTPAVARMGPTHLIVLRFVEGLGEGITFPALCSLLAQWAPPLEKGKLSTLIFAGVPIGNICSNLFSGFIISYVPGGWPNVFYCFGAVALVWLAVWLSAVHNDPLSHPYISAEECGYLYETIGCIERNKELAPTPWKAILSTPAVWALIVVEIGFDWGAYTIVNDLPKYMNDVLHFSVKQNGFLSAAPYLAQWIMSMASSVLADFAIKRRFLTVTVIRKIYAVIGIVGPGLGVMCASFVGCDKFAATICFTLAMALMGFSYPSIRINSLDLSPNYSASIMALVNGLGSLSGMASPYVVGVLTPNRTVIEWRLVFWIMLITSVTTSVVFVVFGSGELQSWDNSKTSSSVSTTKEKPEQNKQTFIVSNYETKVPETTENMIIFDL